MEIRRLDPHQHRAAFDLARSVWPAAEQAAYALSIETLLLTGQQQWVVLLGAVLDEQLVAAQLAQILPGNVAVVWRPALAHPAVVSPAQVASSLSPALAAELERANIRFAQALTAPHDEPSRELFALYEFLRTAKLLYMCAEPQIDPQLRLPFQMVPLTRCSESHLQPLINQTYVGTLDCPGLDGLRETADVIAGYRAVGLYRPDLWFVARQQEEDIGCLLLNLHPDVNHLEIVYLAIVPEVRGQGYGLQLARFAKDLAGQLAVAQIVLAVDAANHPAVRAYESAGFRVFDHRDVWIRTFPNSPQHPSSQ